MPHRAKTTERKYTGSEVRQLIRQTTVATAKHNVLTTFAACGLSMHRILHIEKDEIESVLRDMDSISFNAFSFEEVRKQLLDEAGVDISEFVDLLEG